MNSIFVPSKTWLSAVTVMFALGLNGCTNQTRTDTDIPAASGSSATSSASTATNTSNLPCCTTTTTTTYPTTNTNTPVVTAPTTTTTTTVTQPVTTTPVAVNPTNVTPADGRPAVQVLASSQYSTASGMVQQMRAAGFNAVITQVGGLYKVRIPYNTVEEARSNLARVRATVPDAFLSY